MGRLLTALFLFAMLAGCGEDMESVNQVSKFRVLAVQADPPEIKPGEGTRLTVLWADPKGEGREVSFVWITCLGYLSASADLASSCEPFSMPQMKTAEEGGDVYLIPFTPPDALAKMLPGETRLEVTATVLGCAGGTLPSLDDLMDAKNAPALDEMCAGGESFTAFKTFVISDSDAPNTNPEIDKLYFDSKLLLPVEEDGVGVFKCTASDGCRSDIAVKLYFTEDSFQTYEKTTFGKTEVVDEANYVSWFVSGGEMGRDRSGTSEPPGPYEVKWLPPLDGGKYTLWAVAHDVRGGVSWKTYSVEARTAK
ncbi:MAG: hypothetical protein PHU25_13075 [Deltaproteobacteria bacterium]|nr:hypothetical protein [Deltaproteobacteria bacterium]